MEHILNEGELLRIFVLALGTWKYLCDLDEI
jgi:hypothetical protein